VSTTEASPIDAEPTAREALERRLQEFVGKPYGEPVQARDPVNVPMIRHLTDALGDRNPVYTDEEVAASSIHGGIVAPATSLQVWTMQGLVPRNPEQLGDDATDDRRELIRLLDEAGYFGVVATNCEQTYNRYLRPGDLLTVTSDVESISDLKRTALGEGYFITTLQTYRDQQGEIVGEMRFRIFKFHPANVKAAPSETREAPAASDLPPPPLDVAFFWEGVGQGELRIQRCVACGRLRHPPRPMCPHCGSLERDHIVSGGIGSVYSYVVHHHPPVPGRESPFAVAVVELEEGTRIVGDIVDTDPAEVHIGMVVEVIFAPDANGRVLPSWRPR